MDNDPERRPPAQRADEEADPVEESSIESFPASDPPSFTPVTHPGPPEHGEVQEDGATESREQDVEDSADL